MPAGSFAAVFLSLALLLALLPSASFPEENTPIEKMEEPVLKGTHPGDPDQMIFFDFEGPVFIENGKMIKDHAFIKTGDTFHIFYITDEEKSFGHAISTDLRHWEILGRVLQAGPETVEIWAPCVVPFEDYPGYHLIYYTGINHNVSQTTHLAFSNLDLTEWTEAVPERFEPFHPDTTWAEWSEDTWSNCRDPWFFTDDDGSNYLINTARTKTGFGAISLAVSDWYFDFTDIGPLYLHNNWHSLESSFLMKRNGIYHLFFTEEEIGGISHMSSATLTGGWNIIFRAIIDNGHACELLRLNDEASLFSRHSSYILPSDEIVYSIRVDTLTWSGTLPEVTIEDPLGPDWTILWGTAFNRQPVFGDAYHYRGDDSTEVGFEGNWWIGTSESFDGPLLGSAPGASQGDLPTGAIRSKDFIVTGRSMKMLVGGGCYPGECYIALKRSHDGAILFSETGKGVESMDERIWDIERYMGREVYIEIVDNSSAPMGHINIDSIKESPFPVTPHPPAPGELDRDGDKRDPECFEGSTSAADIPSPRYSVSCYPNPFNPSTKIEFRGEADRLYQIRIFDISGRTVDSFVIRTGSSGTGYINWNGTDSREKAVASGIYVGALCDKDEIFAVCKLVLTR